MIAKDARHVALLARDKQPDILNVIYFIRAAAEDGLTCVDVNVRTDSLPDVTSQLEADGYRVQVIGKLIGNSTGVRVHW